jgi:hypothetical protein
VSEVALEEKSDALFLFCFVFLCFIAHDDRANKEGGTPSLLLLRLASFDNSYLVDPASSHMLVSKIKPCMSKYKHLYTVKLRTAHYISYYLFDGTLLHGYP